MLELKFNEQRELIDAEGKIADVRAIDKPVIILVGQGENYQERLETILKAFKPSDADSYVLGFPLRDLPVSIDEIPGKRYPEECKYLNAHPVQFYGNVKGKL